jgi:hypothetical protein
MGKHCCEYMRREAERVCEQHPDRFACPDCLVHYSPTSGGFGLIIHDGGRSVIRIRFCPWCGSPLLESLRDDEAVDRPNMHSPCTQETWAVWRIDDNGNSFVVREHLGREEAEQVVSEFTARGHKQMYWAERERSGDPA